MNNARTHNGWRGGYKEQAWLLLQCLKSLLHKTNLSMHVPFESLLPRTLSAHQDNCLDYRLISNELVSVKTFHTARVLGVPWRELNICRSKWGGADAPFMPIGTPLSFPIIMAATDGEIFNPAYETFRKHSADLLTAIQDPEVLAWELYAENIIPPAVRDAANNTMHERGKKTSDLLAAVDSQIAVDSRAFNVFLSVLAKRPSMNDLCERMKDTYGKSVGQAHLEE